VLGEFPEVGDDTLIPPGWIIAARERELPRGLPVELGIDVARFGQDESVIIARWGNVARIVKTLRQRDLMAVGDEWRRLIGSFWHGSMANAMAQAIGAQAAFPGRQVISLSGDGGFTMLMGDFLSLVQLGLPAKVVVFNNGALGFIELEQKSTGFLPFGTEFRNPNFAAMAETVGVRGIRIEDPAEVESGIAAALAHQGPVLVDAVVNRTELAMPPSITMEMAKGFTLYMVKAVISGRADEVIDLARVNLWR
jgi:pyruvate dehydrogenase (quinone)